MKLFWIMILFCTNALAEDPFAFKRGVTFGVGLVTTQYHHRILFDGISKNRMNDSFVLTGPVVTFGFDSVAYQSWLMGIRVEGYIADSLATGQKSKATFSDKTAGKQTGINVLGRFGHIFNYKGSDPIDQGFNLISEFFLEAGLGAGNRSFASHYNNSDFDESYAVNLDEKYVSRLLSLGINLSSGKGTYFEAKIMQTVIISNTGEFSGASKVNGGAVTPISRTLKDYNRDPIYGLMMTIGHHY
jgi:hypothetical protein